MTTPEQRLAFYKIACKEGLIIPHLGHKKEKYQLQKIKQYIRKGYRIRDYGSEFEVINIFDKPLDRGIVRNIENMYLALL